MDWQKKLMAPVSHVRNRVQIKSQLHERDRWVSKNAEAITDVRA